MLIALTERALGLIAVSGTLSTIVDDVTMHRWSNVSIVSPI
jgi:hypothetical protein